jgi:hypothetical protein
MKEYLQLLKQKDFFLLWFGQGVSEVGSKLHSIVLIWLIISFLFSAFTELFIQIPGAELRHGRPTLWRDITTGWQYIRETPVVKFVILFFAAAMIFFSFTYVLKTVLLVEVFALTAGEYGTVMTKVIAISGLCLSMIVLFFIRQPVYQYTVFGTENK